ncbi:response regulator [Flammeovirga kamogawensis]|uniref:Response regulator n=1 Tax=Flammeovirga kamogawensis TaxID=373891 RepID=A0ABX8H353_9BACT|nr:response regulator [Flammeovirga kamogawensis]QWG10049.1 response regulator [Flammeovirga kamogawensis]TRX65556.1 response regulator [Flammeovirga kamogawensis]
MYPKTLWTRRITTINNETFIIIVKLGITTPILAITANTEDDLVNQYFDVGMNACIPKPYGQEELQQSIMKLL